jgi:hypothetical protein
MAAMRNDGDAAETPRRPAGRSAAEREIDEGLPMPGPGKKKYYN